MSSSFSFGKLELIKKDYKSFNVVHHPKGFIEIQLSRPDILNVQTTQ